MELKPYQQQVINDLDKFLEYVNTYQDSAKAFNQFWEDKVGKYQANLDGSYSGMKPYKNNIPGATHIAVKVPTAGGKTFIACNALSSIFKSFDASKPKAVVWLVPWSNLLQQTVGHLSNPTHPYREKLNALFGNRVEVLEKEQLLQGAGFNPTSVQEQLNIFVFNFSSIRINSRKKDDRKVYEQNGALEQFRGFVDNDLIIEDTDETALINVIRSLNPVVVVDESHNAESDLSVEMLNNLNPSFVLDLTATPKENSNIISFVNAMALKKEHMVKLPVIVYNHHKKEEVITSALHLQRQLELLALEEEKVTGKYIRPIILFQAQSNIKGKDNTTYIHIKEQLTKLKIPEEQIKIKVSGLDELKGINLMAIDCEVRYIITVNALKEGWDCPNAYILASLADKSSAVDVEQILGRVLRQPYVTKHQTPLLNLSFVLSASSKFQDTLDNIVKALQESGFSKDDYYAEEEPETELSDNEVLQNELFGESEPKQTDDDTPRAVDEIEVDEIDFNPETELTPDQIGNTNDIVKQITQKGESEGKSFEQKAESYTEDNTDYLLREMGKEPKKYKIEEPFVDVVSDIEIPQFYRKVPNDELHDTIIFEELTQKEQLLNRNSLLKGFKLASKSTEINFDDTATEVFQVDYNETKHTATMQKLSTRAKSILVDTILAKPKETQIKEITSLIVRKLGDMTPISHEDITKYVSRVFEDLNNDQIRDIINNEFLYIRKIKDKVKELENEYAKEQFQLLLDTNNIMVKPSFKFPPELTHINLCSPINKSLYEREASVNNFEQKVIMDIASLENVLFWHRNLEKGKGFALNGFKNDHYPDFIIYTQNGNLILIETKGDHLDNDDSRSKNLLGKKWAEKSGDNYKYFMVFETKDVPDTYTAQSIIDVVRML
ncbi:DEAD/DEAH box helicase family protein [Carboxylicivirga sp. A043]|uniref:DEAD/DEAH box helicase n=1 Tax=Carboxylicivirga litoralis TaxID=2816963 RepID=UPI0021CB46AF|nr:DEAD/DEAH box helicase family protein [Carboxylicivirga sp. A043]MCU4158265.1 DEAD/DEAH box helicase family protein [Carboxylicivirga sp. A043]